MVIDLPFHLNIELQDRGYFSIFQNTLHILTLFSNRINSYNFYPKYTIRTDGRDAFQSVRHSIHPAKYQFFSGLWWGWRGCQLAG